jgi:hypothetical protein
MRAYPAGQRNVRRAAAAGALALALSLAVAGCGRPADETWLRVTSIKDGDDKVVSSLVSTLETTTVTTTTTTSATSTETSTESSVETKTETSTGTPDYVTVEFANQSTVVGTSRQAGGVTVEQVQIGYRLTGYSPPGATHAVTLYVPAGTSSTTSSSTSSTTTSSSAGTASLKIPIVSSELKAWLVANVPRSVREQGISGSARMVFHATTDDGGEVETSAGIGVEFVSKVTSTATTTETTKQ